MTAPVKVLFLAGMGRSGTTLLERVLTEVPGVVGVGELLHAWERGVRDDELCGCGLAFSRCGFWSDVGTVAFGGWEQVDVAEVARLRQAVDRVRHVPELMTSGRPGFRRARTAYADYYNRVYRAVHEVTGARVVVDSSKQASLAHVLSCVEGVDLRVLHCVRDARAVCHSWTKTARRPEVIGAVQHMPRYSPRTMAAMWSSHNLAVELVRRHGTPLRRIRYEDFVRDVRRRTTEVLHFVDEYNPPGSLSHIHSDHVELGSSHTAAGNPMRFRTGAITVSPDDSWRAAMPKDEQTFVTAMTAPLLHRYGYPLARVSSRRAAQDVTSG